CGRNKLAFICGPQNYKYSRERKAGFLEVLQRYHLSVPQNWVVQMPDNNYDLAYSALCHLLSSPEIPNGIFACSDVYATAVIRAARRYALQVPADIMVVGFDNVDLAVMTTPSLTTISQPRYQMGYTACNLLLERLNDANAEVKSMLLETELIVRESTTAKVQRSAISASIQKGAALCSPFCATPPVLGPPHTGARGLSNPHITGALCRAGGRFYLVFAAAFKPLNANGARGCLNRPRAVLHFCHNKAPPCRSPAGRCFVFVVAVLSSCAFLRSPRWHLPFRRCGCSGHTGN
ncbi:MAG: substrate-binding domain-containing protein, partial [Pygmaiobacter sp.]|nr:substrate-binding domain-containing protein [Pygmaiobacter sp.]